MPSQDNRHLTKYSGEGARWKKWNRKHALKGSQTPGHMKTNNLKCRPTMLDKYMATKSRSYKHPDYSKWVEKVRSFN